MNCFYDPKYEQDRDVQYMWYIFCYFFLTKINKEWKDNLQPARLRKKAFLFDHITTSDEAMTRWFLKLWEPKIQDQINHDWPIIGKSQGEGEQELRKGLNDYVAIYSSIAQSKLIDGGDLACKWNDIFWAEMEKHHAEAFRETSFVTNPILPSSALNNREEAVILPDIDDDDNYFELSKKRKSACSVLPENENTRMSVEIEIANQDISASVTNNAIDQETNYIQSNTANNSCVNSDDEIHLKNVQSHPI